MTMIEKVARALCKAEHDSWDDLPESLKAMFFASARAAIEAMREPTEKMSDAGFDAADALYSYGDAAPSSKIGAVVWRAMLDAAFSEVEQSSAK